MKPRKDSPAIQRRQLLGGVGTVGALAAAATMLPTRQDTKSAADAAGAPEPGGGYRITEHVLRYYQTTKI